MPNQRRSQPNYGDTEQFSDACRKYMQNYQVIEHADQKEGHSTWTAQLLKRHDAASSKCVQKEQQVHLEMQNEDYRGQPNLM